MPSFAPTTPTSCPRPFRSRIVDGFIAIVLGLFALDTLPCTPQSIRKLIEPLLNVTGLWQGTWSLFAPIPDQRNHRLRADLHFVDGTHREWNSPDWPSQTAWQRFRGHRESEFIEKIWEDDNSDAWPGFAKFLVQEDRERRPSVAQPERVVLSVIWGDIQPPQGDTWRPLADRPPLDHERVFFTLIYPKQ